MDGRLLQDVPGADLRTRPRYNGSMSLTRDQKLTLIRQSRKATKALAALVRNDDCNLEAVETLLEQGAIVEEAYTKEPDKRGGYHIHKIPAIVPILSRNQQDVAGALWKAGSVDRKYRQDWMERAIRAGANACLETFIALGGTHKLPEATQADLLQAAAATGNEQALSWLLKAGLDPNARTHDEHSMGTSKETPLHRARTAQCAQLLLDAGADPNIANERGLPALYMLLSMAGSESRDRSRDMEQSHNKARELMAAAATIIRAGGKLEAKMDNGYTWRVVEGLNEIKIDCTELVAAVAPRLEASDIENKVKTLHLARALLKAVPGLRGETLMSRHAWDTISIKDPIEVDAMEALMEQGVPPPRIYQIDEHRRGEWLAFGIPVSQEDLDKIRDDLDEDGVEISNRPDPDLVAQSNARALARVAARSGAHGNAPRLKF